MDLDSDEDTITDEEVVAIAKLEPSDIDTYVLSLNETANIGTIHFSLMRVI